MPRKVRKIHRKRKPLGRALSPDRAAKDEKARYERCRRRRKGLVKKASEFSALFGDEVHIFLKNSQRSFYFTTEDGWASTPHDIVGNCDDLHLIVVLRAHKDWSNSTVRTRTLGW